MIAHPYKILQVISNPSGGGAEVLVRELGAKLSKYGVESNAVYFNADSPSSDGIHLNKNEIVLGVKSRSLWAIFKLRKLFKSESEGAKYLVVHAHLTWALYYVAIASIGLKIILVYTEHSTHNKRRELYFLRFFESFIYDRYSQIYCISEGVSIALERWLGSSFRPKLKIIPNGGRLYSLHERNNYSVVSAIKLISVGSLKSTKGFQTIIKALPTIKEYVSKYTIVGEGPLRGYLQSLVIELNLKDVVEFIGWSDDLEQYYHAADIQVIPSKWEGFGLVAVEGMSTGLPIIASNVDGLREVLSLKNESIRLIDRFKDAKEWAVEIKNMVSLLPEKRYEWSRTSRKQAEKFGLEQMLGSYTKQYNELNESF